MRVKLFSRCRFGSAIFLGGQDDDAEDCEAYVHELFFPDEGGNDEGCGEHEADSETHAQWFGVVAGCGHGRQCCCLGHKAQDFVVGKHASLRWVLSLV